MTASPTHPRTEPRLTDASEELLDALGSRDARIYGEPFRVQLREIEVQAAKRERDRIATTIDALRARTADDIGMRGAQWLWSDDILAAISEGSPDPVPDEPPGVATEMHGK